MKKVSWPYEMLERNPLDPSGDPDRDIAPGVNDGSQTNGYGTFNDSISTYESSDNPSVDPGYSESIFFPLNEIFSDLLESEQDIEQIRMMSNAFLSKFEKGSTILGWGPQEDSFAKNARNRSLNIISITGDKAAVSMSSFATRFSSPMFYLSSKKADGFYNSRLFSTKEEADIALRNIYSNLRPISYALILSKDNIEIDTIAKSAGFEVIKKTSGGINKLLLKKNDLDSTAVVRHYDSEKNCLSSFRCDVADSDIDKLAGLQPYNSLSSNCGLLFKYNSSRDLTFHMGAVKFPIDIIFVDSNSTVKKIYSNINPGSLDIFSCAKAQYVLETLGGVAGSANISEGDKLFIDLEPSSEDLKKESDLLNMLGISNYIVKRSKILKSSIETFDKYSILTCGSADSISASSLVKSASIRDQKESIAIFNLEDMLFDDSIKLYRESKSGSENSRVSLFSKSFSLSDNYIHVPFRTFASNNFYKNLGSKYNVNLSDIIYSVNKNKSDLVNSVYKYVKNADKSIAFVYSSECDPTIVREALEVSINARFNDRINLSELDCFRIPSGYSSEDIIIASRYRHGEVLAEVVSDGLIKSSGIPVPDKTKNAGKKIITMVDRAKKGCNTLIENLEKNESVYSKIMDKPEVVRNSAGEYRESCKRNARICKQILLQIQASISDLASIKDVSTTEEVIGSLADTSQVFSSFMKSIFDLESVIDSDEFVSRLSEATSSGIGSIDDLKITIDRCKKYVSRDILGIIILSE
jgi:uncharacterized membrane protein (UPF0127 family)